MQQFLTDPPLTEIAEEGPAIDPEEARGLRVIPICGLKSTVIVGALYLLERGETPGRVRFLAEIRSCVRGLLHDDVGPTVACFAGGFCRDRPRDQYDSRGRGERPNLFDELDAVVVPVEMQVDDRDRGAPTIHDAQRILAAVGGSDLDSVAFVVSAQRAQKLLVVVHHEHAIQAKRLYPPPNFLAFLAERLRR